MELSSYKWDELTPATKLLHHLREVFKASYNWFIGLYGYNYRFKNSKEKTVLELPAEPGRPGSFEDPGHAEADVVCRV